MQTTYTENDLMAVMLVNDCPTDSRTVDGVEQRLANIELHCCIFEVWYSVSNYIAGEGAEKDTYTVTVHQWEWKEN